MKKKDFNVFSVSFLDVLSGALASVIILFIIVPKIDIEQYEQLQAISDAEWQLMDLDSMVHLIRASVPDSEYIALVDKIKEIQVAFEKAKEEATILEAKVAEKGKENDRLREELDKAIKDRDKWRRLYEGAQEKIEDLTDDIAAVEPPTEVTPDPVPIRQDSQKQVLLPINIPLFVSVQWTDPKYRVHLYMRKKDGGLYCYRSTKMRQTPFGRWMKPPKSFTKNPGEMIVQNKEIVPGEYNVYAQLAYPKRGAETTISGSIGMNPSKESGGIPQLVNLGDIKVQSSPPPYYKGGNDDSLLGTLTVTETTIQWTAAKK